LHPHLPEGTQSREGDRGDQAADAGAAGVILGRRSEGALMYNVSKSTMKCLMLGLLLCTLAGCASMGATSRVSNELAVAPGGDSGEIFGSILFPQGMKEPVYMRYQLDFRPVGEKGGGFVALTNTIFDSKDSYDLEIEGYRGKTFRQVLPPGEYELYNYSMSSDTGQMSMRFFSRQPFSVRFKVGSNEKVYLGRFLARGVWGKGLFGMRMADGGYFELQDRLEEDAALASRKGRTFEPAEARRAHLQVVDHANLFIRAVP
jgi:hypothetical protein